MNLLTFVARKFKVPLTHTVTRHNKEIVYELQQVAFTDRQLVATYGDDDIDFDILIRGLS